ncbi:MAG: hypothetical protein CMP10_20735 [Zetaproteobacteria bacterium]|nr:hypothetical protein [Pseudobdellovibrionaceae bacterium]
MSNICDSQGCLCLKNLIKVVFILLFSIDCGIEVPTTEETTAITKDTPTAKVVYESKTVSAETAKIEVTSGDLAGTTLNINTGTLSVGTVIEIASTAQPQAFATTEVNEASPPIAIVALDEDGQQVLEANSPMTITLPVKAAGLNNSSTDQLCMLLAPSADLTPIVWRRSALTVENNTVSVKTVNFGVFQVVYCGTEFMSGFDEAKDETAPTVVIKSSQDPGPTQATTINLTVTFSEKVTGFILSDITVTGGTAGNFQGSGQTYQFDITSPTSTITANIAANVAQDEAGNGNTAASQWQITYNQPQVALDCSNLAGGSWIKVPGDSDYDTEDFCVMKYDAKNVSGAAYSQAGSLPWVNISQTGAKTSCEQLGNNFTLISNPEWLTIATNIAIAGNNWSGGSIGSGALSVGHTDNNPKSRLEADENDNNGCINTGQSCNSTTWHKQRRTLTLSNNNIIWDFSGNSWSWTTYYAANGKPIRISSFRQYTSFNNDGPTILKSHLVPTQKSWWQTTWNSNQGIGQYYSGNAIAGTLRRGGSYSNTTTGGIFTANTENTTTYSRVDIGFRCVYNPP